MKFLIKHRITLALIGIMLMAFYFRVIGINWDQNQHLHPDERFLTMVTERLEIPEGIREYLDPNISPMNPYNKETGFYVYGVLPVTIVKIGALLTDHHDYDGIAIFGRMMSALFDMGTFFFVYRLLLLLVERLKKPMQVVLIGTFIYAVLVLPIQISHFYTVDNLLVLCTTASVYFACLYHLKKKIRHVLVASILFGCALACKVSAVYISPLIIALIIIPKNKLDSKSFKKHVLLCGMLMLSFGIVSYLTLRVADPHLFKSANFLNPYPAEKLIANMKELANLASDNAGYFPPAVQWRNITPVIFALKNLVFFGTGIPAFILSVMGIFYLLRKGTREWRIIVGWVVLFFLYQSTRYSPSMRYFLILYPFLAVFGAVGLWHLIAWLNLKSRVNKFLVSSVIMLLLTYPVSFVHIYSVPHSRVTASYWMNENLPTGSIITMEHWDDGLPLRVPSAVDKMFTVLPLPVFAEDNVDKWKQMQDALSQADYVVMSSNRGYGSVLKQKEMYPIMSKWYEDLFAGNLSYELEKEFTSYPSLCMPFTSKCIEFDDQWSEEAFTVYDHPKVTIFKKIK